MFVSCLSWFDEISMDTKEKNSRQTSNTSEVKVFVDDGATEVKVFVDDGATKRSIDSDTDSVEGMIDEMTRPHLH